MLLKHVNGCCVLIETYIKIRIWKVVFFSIEMNMIIVPNCPKTQCMDSVLMMSSSEKTICILQIIYILYILFGKASYVNCYCLLPKTTQKRFCCSCIGTSRLNLSSLVLFLQLSLPLLRDSKIMVDIATTPPGLLPYRAGGV